MIPLPFFKPIKFDSPLALDEACEALKKMEKREWFFYGTMANVVKSENMCSFWIIHRPNRFATIGLQGKLIQDANLKIHVFAQVSIPNLYAFAISYAAIVFTLIIVQNGLVTGVFVILVLFFSSIFYVPFTYDALANLRRHFYAVLEKHKTD